LFSRAQKTSSQKRGETTMMIFSQNRTNDTSGRGGGKVTTSTSIYNQSETKLRSDVISFEASSMLPLPYLPSIWNHGKTPRYEPSGRSVGQIVLLTGHSTGMTNIVKARVGLYI